MSREQTAVEWLFKQIYGDTGHIGAYTVDGKDASEAFLTASAMERQQIMDAFDDGVDECYLEVDELGMRMVTPDECGGLNYYEKKFEDNE
jgi:hypothetical protein